MEAAWQEGLSDEVAHAFGKQLSLLQRAGGTMDAAQMNAKFAGSTFEGEYWNLEEYLAGIEKHIGLSAVNVYEGMLMQCCIATDSKAIFKVPNNGGYETRSGSLWSTPISPRLPWRAPQHKTRRLQSCARVAETWRRTSRHSDGCC